MSISLSLARAAESRVAAVDLTSVPFSTVMSDHMLVAEYRDGVWGDPEIRPYGPLPLSPVISGLQYGVTIFEGLKAFRQPDGGVALFRPAANARRLNLSAARMAIPPLPEPLFLEGVRALVSLDRAWVPPHRRGALYVRLSVFSIDESMRVKPAERFALSIVSSPFSAYYAAPVDVFVTDRYVRACLGGTGGVKPAGNYGPTLVADAQARDLGCHTVLWLDARERRYVEECGVMNVFFVIGDEIATPPLSGTILPGVTRDSAITVLRDEGHVVRERAIAIDEIVQAHDEGRLCECFGTGTAATVAHVRSIRHGDREIVLPPIGARPIADGVRERLTAIMQGTAADPHGWRDRLPDADHAA